MENYERISPQAIDIERTVLGSMLIDSSCVSVAIELLNENSFYMSANRIIFKTIKNMFLKNIPVDCVTVADELKKMKLLEAAGNETYIGELSESIASFKNMEYYCGILIDKQERREGIQIASEMQNSFFCDNESSGREITNTAVTKIINSQRREINKTSKISELLPAQFEWMERVGKNGVGADLITGYPTIDKEIPIQNGDNIVIAGRPSMGKSSVVGCIVRKLAAQGKRVLQFTLETRKNIECRRHLFSEAMVNLHLFNSGLTPKRDLPKLSVAARPLSEWNIHIDDDPYTTPATLYSKVHRIQNEFGKIDLLTFDYLQLMKGDKNYQSRNEAVGDFAQHIKNIGMKFGFPTISISQLKRPQQITHVSRPMLSDLRESGEIEQIADIVVLLHRPEYYMSDKKAGEEELINLIEIIIAKNRNGPAGLLREMVYLKKFMRLEEKVKEQEVEQVYQGSWADDL